jgi:hypothetical protein
MATTTQQAGLWDPLTLEENVLYRCDFSTLTIWLKRSNEDWYLASRELEQATAPSALREIKGKRADCS